MHGYEERVVKFLIVQVLACLSKDLIDSGFTRPCGPYQHDTVTYKHGLVQLDDLLDLRLLHLETIVCSDLLNHRLNTTVVMLRNLHTREQILQDGLEK